MSGFDVAYWGPGGVDISRWRGGECARGVAYISRGDGLEGQHAVRKLSSGRKWRGMASGALSGLGSPKDGIAGDVAGVGLNRWGN